MPPRRGASLHNLSFIKDLELHEGCRVLVSKRNMIIPHIEENLDRGRFSRKLIPKKCPCCGSPTRVYSRKGDGGRKIETLHCDNAGCKSQIIHKFRHFAGKKAMDMKGISEGILRTLVDRGILLSYHDFYDLSRYKEEIVKMDGFGEKSYQKIIDSIEESRNTTFARYVVAMDIPMVGRTASRELEKYFRGDLRAFEEAAITKFEIEAPDGA